MDQIEVEDIKARILPFVRYIRSQVHLNGFGKGLILTENFSIAQILLTLGGIIFHASIAPNSDPSKAIKG